MPPTSPVRRASLPEATSPHDLSGTVYVSPSGSLQGDGSKNVIVEFCGGPHDAGFDLRCH
ncbi:hypothetical protein AB0C28_32400 [Nonomuraea sp. NPDC048892]|uniref:hypothetical protein n=1 Tax=Nonomuraea sp. NPDC048892 TaxID=3154624 RepID=UPI0033DC4BAC